MISNLGITTIVLGWIFAPISIVTLGLHTFHRVHHHSFGLDDFLLLLASVGSVLMVIMITWGIIDEEADQHLDEVTWSKLSLISHVSMLVLDLLTAF